VKPGKPNGKQGRRCGSGPEATVAAYQLARAWIKGNILKTRQGWRLSESQAAFRIGVYLRIFAIAKIGRLHRNLIAMSRPTQKSEGRFWDSLKKIYDAVVLAGSHGSQQCPRRGRE